jgi:hypothetical protein
MKKELTQADIERRAAKRAKKIERKTNDLERDSIKSQETGRLGFGTPGQHGLVYSGERHES